MLDEQVFRTADLCIVGNINRDVRQIFLCL
jgi:hypothetical protein